MTFGRRVDVCSSVWLHVCLDTSDTSTHPDTPRHLDTPTLRHSDTARHYVRPATVKEPRHRSDTGPTPAPTEPDTSDTGVNRHRPDTGPTLPDTARHPRHSDTPGLKARTAGKQPPRRGAARTAAGESAKAEAMAHSVGESTRSAHALRI